MRKTASLLLTAVVCLLTPGIALAWGGPGHRIVGRVAQRQLSAVDPDARDKALQILLSQERCPSPAGDRSFAGVSGLADEYRNPEGGQVTREWHFVNIDVANATYDEERDCPSGDCVTRRIDRMLDMLKDRTKSRCEKKDALLYLIHFVGDIHQPFHCGFGRINGVPDKGGNDIQVRIGNRTNNLHSVWDSTLISRTGRGEQEWVDHLMDDVVPELDEAQVANLDTTTWTNESHAIVIERRVEPDTVLSAEYIEESTEIIEQRLALAGLRLAALIQQAFP